MTFKRLVVILLTAITVLLAGSSLIHSWQEPQFKSSLELYQTDMVLQASTWEPENNQDNRNNKEKNYQTARNAILGEKPVESAIKEYEAAQKSAKVALAKTENRLKKLQEQPIPTQPQATLSQPNQKQLLLKSLQERQKNLAEIDLRLGILQAQQQKSDLAIQTWKQVQEQNLISPDLQKTSRVLTGIWENPPRILPDAPELTKANLSGWYQYTALSQLYRLQQRDDALLALEASQQNIAEQAVIKLAIVGVVPNLTLLIGFGLLIFLIVQRFLKGKESLLAQNSELKWLTPWDAETTLLVFVGGFFLMAQFVVPLIIGLLPLPPATSNIRIQAGYVLLSYVLMAIGAVLVVYVAIKPFLPLPEGWFRFRLGGKWILWGFGGYCVALPIVLLVSLINQQIWQGQGGSNPLLELALEGQDSVTLGIFFTTAAIAAPLFEEFLFRGFLLPSFTRYIPVWGSILLSALIFAIAHLSLSEILPLLSLGIVLGIVYTRSRNLLAPMLLHSIWNGSTLLSLFVLGSGNN
ncbi:MAG: CPBP family intramembrane metalloprotease [Calothrix sp. CSU_2_0]|nr:CPBP family intramembrane metalloprotease [Calothrix sp. CSU_2_0]